MCPAHFLPVPYVKVVVAARHQEQLNTVTAEIIAAGGKAASVVGDVRKVRNLSIIIRLLTVNSWLQRTSFSVCETPRYTFVHAVLCIYLIQQTAWCKKQFVLSLDQSGPASLHPQISTHLLVHTQATTPRFGEREGECNCSACGVTNARRALSNLRCYIITTVAKT